MVNDGPATCSFPAASCPIAADIQTSLTFEAAIADLSSRFILLPPVEVDQALEDALRRVCNALEIDLAVLWQWSESAPDLIRPTHSYPALEGPRPGEPLRQEHYPWMRRQMREGRVVRISSLDDLPADEAAVDRLSARAAGIQSSLCLPLLLGGDSPIGALALNALQAQREWPDPLVNRLQLVAQVLTNAIARRRHDTSLRESEGRLALAADAAEAGLWTLDFESGRFWATERARAIFGFSPEEVITTARFQEWVHPGDWALVQRILERSRMEGDAVDVEYRIVPPGDGGERWINSRGRPVRDPSGRITGLTGVSFDTTVRRAAERDARERLEFEILIADLSSRFINLPPNEVDSEIEKAQRRVCEVLGVDLSALWEASATAPTILTLTHFYGAQEDVLPPMRGMSAAEYFPWLQREMFAGRTVRLSSLHQLPEEAALDRDSLRTFGVQSNLTFPLSVGGASVVSALGFNTTRAARDWPEALVTRLQLVGQIFANALARKRTEQVLLASQTRLEAATELAGLAFYEMNLRDRTGFIDDRLADVCGIPPESRDGLEGVTFWIDHLHPEDRPRVMKLREQLHDGFLDRLSIEYRYCHPAGGERWVHHLALVLLRDAAGRAVITRGVLRDVTGQKRASEEVADLSRRLIRAQEDERAMIARELHDDVTQRLAVLAIDAGRAEIAAGDGTHASSMRALREELTRLSEDVHALAYQLHSSVLEELGLAEALRAACEKVARRAGVEVSSDLLPGVLDLGRDEALCLFRVAQEALHNVARHSRARTAKVALRRMDGGLLLAVRDDGVGFDLASTAPRRTLGLAGMRERLRLVNGTLDIESAPGQGTAVVAWVPVEVASR